MQQTINFEAQAQVTRPAINVRATIQRKKNPTESLQVQKTFVSLSCQTAETNVFDERELAKHPNILVAFQPEMILTAAFHEDSAFRSILRCLTTRKRSRLCVRTSRKLATSNSEK